MSYGTVFAVTTNGTGFKVLPHFTARFRGPYTNSDGGNPTATLILSGNMLIGTASIGGDPGLNNGGNGTVFALDTNGTDFTVSYRFTAGNYDASLSVNTRTNSDGANPKAGLVRPGDTLYGTASLGGSGGNGTVFSLSYVSAPRLTILDAAPSGPDLVIKGANGQAGETNVTLMSTDLLRPLSQWTPVATNILNVTGDFPITATNAVDPKAPRRFYLLQTP